MTRPLVLLFGMPRSGTTWIGKILDSHPDTLYRHEPDAGGALDHVPWVAGANEAPAAGPALRAFVRGLPDMNSPKVAASLPVFPKRYCSRVRFSAHQASVWAAKAGEPLVGEMRVLSPLPYSRRDDVTVVWKSVESHTRIGAVARAVECRRAVVLLRHPCGQIASELRGETGGHFASTDRASEDYEIFRLLVETEPARRRGLRLQHLRELHPLQRLAWKWTLVNETALEGIQGLDGCLALRYEDVCRAPLESARALLAFCGLQWSEQTAAFVRRSTGEHRDAYYSVFKDPARAASRWTQELRPEQISMILDVVRDSPLAHWYSSTSPGNGTQEGALSWSSSNDRRASRSSFSHLPGVWSMLS